jgi:hypothetical protein
MAAPTEKVSSRLAVADFHASLAERARRLGFSRLALARRSGVSYHRLIVGQPLDDDELGAIEAALGARERAMAETRRAL